MPWSSVRVRVTPRAAKSRLEVMDDGTLRVYVTAPPIDGEANAAVCELVAKRLGLAKSKVSVESGHSSRTKSLRIDGLEASEIQARLVESCGQKKLPGT